MQVEQLYNGLLDRADQLREEMGEITDNVSLRTALETIWNDMAGDLRALHACDYSLPGHLMCIPLLGVSGKSAA